MEVRRTDDSRSYLTEITSLLGRDIRRVPLLICYFVLIGLLDVLGIALIVPLVTVVFLPETYEQSQFPFSDFLVLTSSDLRNAVFLLSGVLALVFLAKALTGIFIQWRIVKYSNDQMVRLRGDLMNAYQTLPYDVYTQRNSSEYIFAMQSLTAIYAGRVLLPALKFLSDGFVCLAILVLLIFNIGNVLFALVALIGPAVIVFDRIFKGKLIQYGTRKNDAATKMLSRLNEGVGGLKEIRMVGAERFFYDELVANAQVFSVNESRTQTINLAPRYLIEFLIVIFFIGLIVSSFLTNTQSSELLPILAMLSFGAVRLLPCMNSILTNILTLRANRDAVSRLYNDVIELQGVSRLSRPDREKFVVTRFPFRSIELRDVWYSYPGNSKAVLQGVNLSIEKGQSVGIVGESGAGKSTLVDLLLGLLSASSGETFFNGKPVDNLKDALAQHVAYLPQETFLADASLQENVALGVKLEEIDAARVVNCLDLASLSELVAEMPVGLNTQIGEKGVRLSGGQRQRIALARAFYHERAILVFDEATSALDEKTEGQILTEISKLKGQKTIIMISHKPTTLKYCDKIINIASGKVVQEGTFQEVIGMKRRG